MSAVVSIACNGFELHGDPCPVRDTPASLPGTATEARKELAREGWHRTRDGRDLCPACWSEGVR